MDKNYRIWQATSTDWRWIVIFMAITWGGCNTESDGLHNDNHVDIETPLFQLLDAEVTGVDFVNRLDEGPNTNILLYEYFYNGGGVAVGDINGDGWEDIYFTTNLGENKLYLHNGENATASIQYTDITQVSGARGRVGPWKTGVSVIDINGDNKLDIYLSYSGMLPPVKRKNQLYINLGNDQNGIPKFEDQAEVYGLASDGFSTQGYFLDYDRDGDLDMLLLNHNPKNLPILNETQTTELLSTDDRERGLRLYKQENGVFNDITTKVGLNGSPLSYGLGLAIGDLNNDGWPDFYVSNDYAVPDYLYINDQRGGFENRLTDAIGHTSQFSMGNDITDVNNDGHLDIITLDMLPEDNKRQKLLIAPDDYAKFDHNVRSGFYYQYMRNMLQLNNGDGTFSEIGQYAGIPSTDWSWAALSADYNNDGFRDLYVTNGYNRDYTNQDFINYMNNYTSSKGRLQKQDVLEIIQNMPSSDVANYMFRGSAQIQYENVSQQWGLTQVANSNGAVYADLDNDGDLDLVVNNINKPAFIYENKADQKLDYNYLRLKLEGEGKNLYGIGSRVTLYRGDDQYIIEQYPARGYQSSISPILHVGLGEATIIDSLTITWPQGEQQLLKNISANQLLTLRQQDASPTALIKAPSQKKLFKKIRSVVNHAHVAPSVRDYDRQSLLLHELSHEGPRSSIGDVDGDGLEDLYIGGGAGQAGVLYLNSKKGAYRKSSVTVFGNNRSSVDAGSILLDVDLDGDLDMYVCSGGYHLFSEGDDVLQDRLYLNNGKGEYQQSKGLPDMKTSTSVVVSLDINSDGALDLFVGGRVVPGSYPQTPASYILVNDGSGNYNMATEDLAPALNQVGMVTDAITTDINKDGHQDLIVVGEWMSIQIWINQDGILTDQTSQYIDDNLSGFWNSITAADLNEDGKLDYIIGNSGNNTQFRPSRDQPLELYYKDFDDNGAIDPIVTHYIQGERYPYATRGELLGQLTKYRSVYTSYEKYATATFDQLMNKKELADAGHLEINTTSSIVLMSTADDMYRAEALPASAQYAPLRAIAVMDVNNDSHQDLICLGNHSRVKLRMGKADANYGVVLMGDGKGGLTSVPQSVSGLQIKGDVSDVIIKDDKLLVFKNGEDLETYQLTSN